MSISQPPPHPHAGTPLRRRQALQCLAWMGTGALWLVSGGIPRALALEDRGAAGGGFIFGQISDSHIGFKKEPNADPAGTLQSALDKFKPPVAPAFLLHTGDVSQLAKPEEFDTAEQIIRGAGHNTFYVPGEHDMVGDNGKAFLARFATASQRGWYSFDFNGVHFIALVNVFDLKEGGAGSLGDEQLAWLAADLRNRTASTPIVVFTHIPLWPAYAPWGWDTTDSAQALSQLRRFGSVTVLNGHIHQVMQKVEGNITFHTAMSTAFPQPAPGQAAGPGPLRVGADRLRSLLGVSSVAIARAGHGPTITDTALTESVPAARDTTAAMFLGD